MHEMYHNMGFFHEQTRIDRDAFVKVIWTEIQSGRAHNFYKNEDPANDLPTCNPSSGATTFDDCDVGVPAVTFGIPYDYQSIMHYGESL